MDKRKAGYQDDDRGVAAGFALRDAVHQQNRVRGAVAEGEELLSSGHRQRNDAIYLTVYKE